MMTERLIDVAVVARRLDVCPETVRQWIRAEKIQAIRTPRGVFKIPISELERLKNCQKCQPNL